MTSRQQRLLGRGLLVAVGCLIPWVVYVHVSLPRHYTAAHWQRTWVFFDVALVVVLAWTAQAALRNRGTLGAWATVTATLLVSDAWFDLSTANLTDLPLSAATAVLLELPAAALLYLAAHRHHRRQTSDSTCSQQSNHE